MNIHALRESVQQIDVIQGGCFLSLLQHPGITRSQTTIAKDARPELVRCASRLPREDTFLFPLGQGETAQTQCIEAPPNVQAITRKCAGMSAEGGAGQKRRYGEYANKRLQDSPQYKAFKATTLIPRLRAKSNGRLTDGRPSGMMSLAGGMGSGGLIGGVQDTAETLIESTDAVVTSRILGVGPITYGGLGGPEQCCEKNAAAALADLVAWVSSSARHMREARSILLGELPPDGRDRVKRERHVCQLVQALEATETRAILDPLASNRATKGRLGGVSLFEIGFHRDLESRREIAPEICATYVATLSLILDSAKPQRQLVDGLALEGTRRSWPREDLESILDRAMETPIDEVIAAITRAGFELRITVYAQLSHDLTVNLTEADKTWAAPPVTASEAAERLTTLRTLLSRLTEELTALAAKRDDLLAEYATSERKFRQLDRQLKALSLSARFQAAMTTNESKFRRRDSLAAELRDLTDLLTENAAEMGALEAARQQVQAECDFLVDKIGLIILKLSHFIRRDAASQCASLVAPKPLDDVFAEFWQLIAQADDSELLRVIQRAVKHVTTAGLARIMNADPNRLETIAQAIAAREFAVPGPPWGGRTRLDDGLSIHVLPPLEQGLADALRPLISAYDPQSQVAVADTAVAVLNCVTLTIFEVRHRQEIFTAMYQHYLLEAYHDPQRPLYFTDEANLEAIGIVVGDEVHFSQGWEGDLQ
jgi:hypothetical protein